MIAEFDSQTASQSLTRQQGIDRLKANPEALAQERGEAIVEDVDRADRLARQQEALKNDGQVARLAGLIENFDAATAGQAIRDYEPAVPVTFEALWWGRRAGDRWMATHLVAWPIRRRLRARSLGRGVRAT